MAVAAWKIPHVGKSSKKKHHAGKIIKYLLYIILLYIYIDLIYLYIHYIFKNQCDKEKWRIFLGNRAQSRPAADHLLHLSHPSHPSARAARVQPRPADGSPLPCQVDIEIDGMT